MPRLALVSTSALGAAINDLVRDRQVPLADADLVVVAARDLPVRRGRGGVKVHQIHAFLSSHIFTPCVSST